MTKTDWMKKLERSHNSSLFKEEPMSNLGYLTEYIFGIDTYDEDQNEKIGQKVIEVAEAITNGKTFDYIKDEDDYTWYLIVCHFPFFKDRLGWGTSIRGAWWDVKNYRDRTINLSTCGLLGDGEEQQTEWAFTRDEWSVFMTACVNYAKGETV